LKRLNLFFRVLVLTSIFASGFTLAAAGDEEKPRDINDLLCKDVLRTSGEDRAIVLAFLHGYLLAESGNKMIYRSRLAKASDDFIEACLGDTNSQAIATLKKQLN